MAPFKPKPRQPPMTKAELRAQGIQALAQVTTPIIKLPMKIRRQCGRCGDFNSVLVEPGQAVPAFKCSACGSETLLRIRSLRAPSWIRSNLVLWVGPPPLSGTGRLGSDSRPRRRGPMKIVMLGIDLGKSVYSLAGLDET